MSTMYSIISGSFMSTSRTETQRFQTLAERFQERAIPGFCNRVSYWSELGLKHQRGADVPARTLVLVVTVYLWVGTGSVGCPDVC